MDGKGEGRNTVKKVEIKGILKESTKEEVKEGMEGEK
jgi:hypothetical protein